MQESVAVLYILSGALRGDVLHRWRGRRRYWQPNLHQSVRRQRIFFRHLHGQNVWTIRTRESRSDKGNINVNFYYWKYLFTNEAWQNRK